MTDNTYDPEGGHTREEAEVAYAELFRELHGEDAGGPIPETRGKVAVVGRRPPDTDSVCAAIAYARLKNETDASWEYTPYLAGAINAETVYVLKLFGAQAPLMLDTGDCAKIILVDHNAPGQMAEGIDSADVLEILDHHRLEGPETAAPVWVICRPCGAACTIVFDMFGENGITPDGQIAGLMCAAILSDTEFFNAETTTRADRLACAALANIAALDLEELTAALMDFQRPEL